MFSETSEYWDTVTMESHQSQVIQSNLVNAHEPR